MVFFDNQPWKIGKLGKMGNFGDKVVKKFNISKFGRNRYFLSKSQKMFGKARKSGKL